MTKWEKWIDKIDISAKSEIDKLVTRYQRDFICGSYPDCYGCPLYEDINCGNLQEVKKWLESEVEE